MVGQAFSLIGALLAGVILELNKTELASVIGVFLLLPGIFELGGAEAGAFGAKLSHFHETHPRHAKRYFIPNMFYSLGLILAGSIVLGTLGGLIGEWLFGADLLTLLKITILSSTLAAICGLPLVGLATLRAIRLGLDPDNVIGPVETSLFDLLSIVMTIISVGLLL